MIFSFEKSGGEWAKKKVVSRQPIFVNLKSNTMKKHSTNIKVIYFFYKCLCKKNVFVNNIYVYILTIYCFLH